MLPYIIIKYDELNYYHTKNQSTVAQMAERTAQNRKAPVQTRPGSKEMVHINITRNDGYIAMIKAPNQEPALEQHSAKCGGTSPCPLS